MCLGVPGKVVSVERNPLGMTMGKVSFGGILKEVCLAYVPGVEEDDWVVVHVGFAISRIDEEEAERTLAFLEEMDDLDGLEIEAEVEGGFVPGGGPGEGPGGGPAGPGVPPFGPGGGTDPGGAEG